MEEKVKMDAKSVLNNSTRPRHKKKKKWDYEDIYFSS